MTPDHRPTLTHASEPTHAPSPDDDDRDGEPDEPADDDPPDDVPGDPPDDPPDDDVPDGARPAVPALDDARGDEADEPVVSARPDDGVRVVARLPVAGAAGGSPRGVIGGAATGIAAGDGGTARGRGSAAGTGVGAPCPVPAASVVAVVAAVPEPGRVPGSSTPACTDPIITSAPSSAPTRTFSTTPASGDLHPPGSRAVSVRTSV